MKVGNGTIATCGRHTGLYCTDCEQRPSTRKQVVLQYQVFCTRDQNSDRDGCFTDNGLLWNAQNVKWHCFRFPEFVWVFFPLSFHLSYKTDDIKLIGSPMESHINFYLCKGQQVYVNQFMGSVGSDFVSPVGRGSVLFIEQEELILLS